MKASRLLIAGSVAALLPLAAAMAQSPPIGSITAAFAEFATWRDL